MNRFDISRLLGRVRSWLAGRYGFDALNWTLLGCYLLLSTLLPRRGVVAVLLPLAALVLLCARALSLNHGRRRMENECFLRFAAPVSDSVRGLWRRLNDRGHRYYRCPACRQLLRVPRGRGSIVITCPRCNTQLARRS